jgi:hypothetical protein
MLGGEKVHVPVRAEFFGALARERRDARIRDLYARGIPVAQIAQDAGMKPNTVWWVLRGGAKRTTPQRES